MATEYKILGQSAPAATTATNVYTVPSSTYAVVSTITVANRGTGAATYRISIRPNGDSQANQHYIAYDASLPGNDTIALTLGLTADASDVFTVYASTADLSFGVFGSEIDV
jgi:hypothetical protein